MEIDERAGALAAFALMMKGRARDRRFFSREVKPNVVILRPITFKEGELAGEPWLRNLPADQRERLLHDLHLFKEADNFGSLLQPELTVREIAILRKRVQETAADTLFVHESRQRVLRALLQAAYLARQYHVVVTNPPYMGSGNMNVRLKAFMTDNYKVVKWDLFSGFVYRCARFTKTGGMTGLMSPNVWMYLLSHKGLRRFLMKRMAIHSLVELPLSGFKGATVQICAFTFSSAAGRSFKSAFIRLVDFRGDEQELAARAHEAILDRHCSWYYRVSVAEFEVIPDLVFAYWISEPVRAIFARSIPLGKLASPKVGLQTGDNERFIRIWHEVSYARIGFGISSANFARESGKKWFPCNKGGDFRRWYGNQVYVINWFNDGAELKATKPKAVIRNPHTYFKEVCSWTRITSGKFSLRYCDKGFLHNDASCVLYTDDHEMLMLLTGVLNSIVFRAVFDDLNPTMNTLPGQISNVPIVPDILRSPSTKRSCTSDAIAISEADWNSFETSWMFTSLPLVSVGNHGVLSLRDRYLILRSRWRQQTAELQELEEENNIIFIKGYGLEEELAPQVPLDEISLTCNPYYRYGPQKPEAELEALLLADTMREFISYAVGCMFGRYSLDKPGLILANQGETLDDYLRQFPEPTFPPDRDNVIPLLDGDWFPDDIAERFKRFLRVTFGDEHYEENLAFVEAAIGRDIRSYFLRDFYDHHVKMYQKRPIYWLFSSPNGSFNALIYLHRYRPDTASIVLNDYLREFRTKLVARKGHLQQVERSASATAGDKTKALKEIDQIDRTLNELKAYEDDILYPLAARQVELDLDDGVLVNYNKLGKALKKVTGLSKN
jgi:hypothetical protein